MARNDKSGCVNKDKEAAGKLVLDGNGRLRMRKPAANAWTKEKERNFLTSLSETCNVKWAAQEAGVSPQRAYERRKSNAGFRAGWTEAIGVAYGRLELILLDRAFNGTEKIVKRRDGSEERMVDYSNQVALTLLKMHRETALESDAECFPDDLSDLRSSIEAKLGRLRRQEEAREAGSADAQ